MGVLTEGDISYEVGFVLDVPMAADRVADPWWVETVGSAAGDAEDELAADACAAMVEHLPAQQEHLRGVWPVDPAGRCDPDRALGDLTTVVFGVEVVGCT